MRRSPILLVLLALAACHPASASPRAVPVPAAIAGGVALTPIASGLSKPVALAVAPGDTDGRLFVVEQTGKIRVLRHGTVDPTPFLDLSSRISTSAGKRDSEQGLLGLAFHPRFADNGRFFVNLTNRKGHTEILEFRAPPGRGTNTTGTVSPDSGRLFWSIEQPYSNHNGGHLVFGPDNLLYIGLGDGGSAGDPQGNGQNLEVRLGKMWAVRPEWGDGDDSPPRMVALGLRNPWRYSFDRKTGDLWIGGVGQYAFEEVDVLTPAMRAAATPTNFGWNPAEGLHCYPSDATCDLSRYTPPVIEYDHDDGCSITGGAVYRGKALPKLDGLYFYADYCTAMIRSLRWDGKTVTDVWDWRAALDPEERLTNLSSFGEDAAGELYLLSLDGGIYKLTTR